MKTNRVIARLDVKGPNIVKGIQFECLRVMGKPGAMAEHYYLQGADELIYLDIVANLYQRDNLINIVNQASESVIIPFTIGGGVRTLDDIRDLLQAGADKVAINTAATKNPKLIEDAARMFGSQCIVVSIEAKRVGNTKWGAYVDTGRQSTGLDAVEWAQKAEALGAGEIFLTSVDREGTEQGLDLDLIKAVSQKVSIPVIGSGGAGTLDDFSNCIKVAKADAIATASLLHYRKYDISQIKNHMASQGIPVRLLKSVKKLKTNPNQAYDITDYNRYTISQIKSEYQNVGVRIEEPEQDVSYGGGQDWDIGVIDCEINNVKSIVKSFEKCGKKARRITTREEIRDAKCLVLPGVGAFKKGIDTLAKKGFIEPLNIKVREGTPLLGICLGMQLLFTESEEFGLHKGLNFISGRVVSLKSPEEVNMGEYRLPHIGWNSLKAPSSSINGGQWLQSLLKSIPQGSLVYFVHSYYPVVANPQHVVATTEYGNQEFAVVVKKDNISATQFHPEKSGEIGLGILRAFCEEHKL